MHLVKKKKWSIYFVLTYTEYCNIPIKYINGMSILCAIADAYIAGEYDGPGISSFVRINPIL